MKKTTLTVFLSDKFIALAFLKLLWLCIYQERADLFWQTQTRYLWVKHKHSLAGFVADYVPPYFPPKRTTQIQFDSSLIALHRI